MLVDTVFLGSVNFIVFFSVCVLCMHVCLNVCVMFHSKWTSGRLAITAVEANKDLNKE